MRSPFLIPLPSALGLSVPPPCASLGMLSDAPQTTDQHGDTQRPPGPVCRGVCAWGGGGSCPGHLRTLTRKLQTEGMDALKVLW